MIVTLPDGREIDVSDDAGPEVHEQIKQKIRKDFPELQEGRGVLGGLRDIGVTGLKGAVGLDQAALGLADLGISALGLGDASELVLGPWQRQMKKAQEGLEELYTPQQQEANKALAQGVEGGVGPAFEAMAEYPSAPAAVIGQSLPSMLGGAGIARSLLKTAPALQTWLAGAAGEGLITAGSTASELEAGGLTPKEQISALGAGTITAGIGAGSGKIAQKLGIADLEQVLATGKVNPEIQKGFLRQLVEAGFTEGMLEEMPQSAQERMWMNYAESKPLMQGVAGEAAVGLTVGGATGGIAGGYSALGKRPEVTPGKPREIPPTVEASSAPPPEYLPYSDEDLQSINPMTLAKTEVEANVYDEEVGKFVRQKVPANQALDTSRSDLEAWERLLDCLRR